MKTFQELLRRAINNEEYKKKSEKLEELLIEFGFEKDPDSTEWNVIFTLPKNPFNIYMKVMINYIKYVQIWESDSFLPYEIFYFNSRSAEEVFDWIYTAIYNKIPLFKV